MRFLSFLIKPVSSVCNMECRYCFYKEGTTLNHQTKDYIMNQETMEHLIHKSLEKKNEKTYVTYAFQGGEPTLAGLDYFKQFVSCVKKNQSLNQEVRYAIETNGFLLDDEWVSFFKEHQFSVVISLDGYKENHDYFRFDEHNQGTYDQVYQAIQLLKKQQVEFNVLTTLTKTLAKHPQKLYRYYKQQQFSFVQLVPCLPRLDNGAKKDPYALTPRLFASFYKQFYKLWESDLKKGDYMGVTLFDNLIPMFNQVPPAICGMLGFCSPQYVVEANGDIYPCDLYGTQINKIGNINQEDLATLSKSKVLNSFLKEEKRRSKLCDACKFRGICDGNCKRMNVVYFDDDGYCGYQDFLEEHAYSMQRIARSIRS